MPDKSTCLARFFCLSRKAIKQAKYFPAEPLCFEKKLRWSFPYPDFVMPLPIYRKSMRETPTYAEAEIGTKEKSPILKYGESPPSVLEANFAIKLLGEVLRDCAHARHAYMAIGFLSMPCIPNFYFYLPAFIIHR